MTELKIIDSNIREKLRANFPKEAYKKHPTKTFLTTLKAAFIFERLNDVFGIGRWDFKHEIIVATEENVVVLGTLLILDYKCTVPSQYGGHSVKKTYKGYELSDIYKSAITDSLSKCASYIEIGIDMFKGLVDGNGNNSAPIRKLELTPKSEKWSIALEKMIEKGLTIEQIRKGYNITLDNYEILKEQATEIVFNESK